MNFKILLLLFIAMISVSTSPIIARYLENVPAIAISLWRMGFGAIILWLFSFIRSEKPLNNSNLKRTIIAGILLGIHFALFFESIKLTSIANATFLGTLAPVFTYLIEKYFLNRNQSISISIGLLLAIIGAIIIIGNEFNFTNSYTIGNFLAIACSIFLGLAFIISENVRSEVGTISYSRTLFLTAAITLFILSLLINTQIIGFSKFEYMGLLILGIIPTLLGHGLMYYSIKYVSPTVVASTPMGEPIIASILAWILFNEVVSLSTFIGGSVTLVGIFIVSKKNN